MLATTTAELSRAIPFPTRIGDPVWQERRQFPVAAAYGVPAVFLVVLAGAARSAAVRTAFAVAALVVVALLLRAHGAGR